MLKDTFCSSPWIHTRINPAGYYLPCRNGDPPHLITTTHHIRDMTIAEYVNSDYMREIRTTLLDGNIPDICRSCQYQDSNNKVSGRLKQLSASSISVDNFTKTFCASPHYEMFAESSVNNGSTSALPVDLQIDLGNTCNSGCIMCAPTYSSKLAVDFVKLHALEPTLFAKYPTYKNWADDEVAVDKFIASIADIPNLKYIHLLGGETFYLRSFYAMCNKLVESGIAKNTDMGTTTNCTIYTPELEDIIRKFKHVYLGLSVESINPINDYIRWPSKINDITHNINKFIQLRETTGIYLTLRITPNIFSIYHIDTIFEFMITNRITAESCDILVEPSCLRMELLPKELIEVIIQKIDAVISKHNLIDTGEIIINRRSDDLIDETINTLIFEYKQLLENYRVPINVEEERYNLVKFIKAFESLRNNTILDYLPEYEEFLRQYGY
jgi:hypothetical protein